MRRARGQGRAVSPKAAAYSEHPSDHTSVLAVIVQFEGTSNSSGALHAKRNPFIDSSFTSVLHAPVLCSTRLCTQLLKCKGFPSVALSMHTYEYTVSKSHT